MRVRMLLPRGYLFTLLGITVGIAGLLALGAMAERITRFIEGGDRFVQGQISVAGEGIGMGTGLTAGGLLPRAKIQEIARVPGVAAVQAQVMLPVNTTQSHFLMLTQELILGLDLSLLMPNRYYGQLPVQAGRFLREGERGAVVVGADFAAARRLRVDGTVRLGEMEFSVVGVLDKILTAPDHMAFVSIQDARTLWLQRDPMQARVFGGAMALLDLQDLNTGAAVGWQPGENPDEVARRIQATVSGVNVTIPGELSRQLRSSTAFFSSLLLGTGTLGLLIGGLSLSNVVTAAMFERIRDFGIKRALGATDLHLLREILGEALAVSLLGSAAGAILAYLIGWGIETYVIQQGQRLFVFSVRLLLFALVFSLLLGTLAATYATLRITRLSPAEAIRRGA